MLPRLIPVMLLDEGGLVKTQRFSSPVYLGDPINALRIFNEKEVDEVIVVDRSARKNGGPDFILLEQLAIQAFMPLSYGGGVTSEDHAQKLFSIGFEKVVLTSALQEDPGFVKRLVARFGAQAIVGGIDVKKPLLRSVRVHIENASKSVPLSAVEAAKQAEALGVGEIFLQNVDNDGVMKGYDIDLIREVAKSVRVPVICCGGAGSLTDFQKAVDAGTSAVAAGSYFVFVHGDRNSILINYPPYAEVKALFKKS